MEDVFKFLLVAVVIVIGLVRQFKKEAKKKSANKPVVPIPNTGMDDNSFPPYTARRGTYGGYIPEGPQTMEQSGGKKGGTAMKPGSPKAATSLYTPIQPQDSPPIVETSESDERTEYGIHSAEEARRAIIWSEILQRKY